MKAFSRHSLVMLSRLFSLRLTRCQVNDCKPGCTPAHPEQRRSRAKAQHTEWTHVVSTVPPQNGWGGIQRVYLAYTRGTVPKWTAYKRDQVIRKYGPWMDFWMLKGIRKIPVHKTWAKYIVERDWYQAPRGTRGPAGVRNCLQLCRDLQPGQKVPGFTARKRHQVAWTYGPFLAKKWVKKLLDY